jgi:hypothetical protein
MSESDSQLKQSTKENQINQDAQAQELTTPPEKGAPEEPPPIDPKDAMIMQFQRGDDPDTVTFIQAHTPTSED